MLESSCHPAGTCPKPGCRSPGWSNDPGGRTNERVPGKGVVERTALGRGHVFCARARGQFPAASFCFNHSWTKAPCPLNSKPTPIPANQSPARLPLDTHIPCSIRLWVKMATQNGTLVNGAKDLNLRSAGGLILTHTNIFHVRNSAAS